MLGDGGAIHGEVAGFAAAVVAGLDEERPLRARIEDTQLEIASADDGMVLAQVTKKTVNWMAAAVALTRMKMKTLNAVRTQYLRWWRRRWGTRICSLVVRRDVCFRGLAFGVRGDVVSMSRSRRDSSTDGRLSCAET